MKYVQYLYDLPHFYDYDNFYTVYEKKSNLIKKVYDDTDIDIDQYTNYQISSIYRSLYGKPHYVIIGTTTTYVPIYGHFLDDNNQFVYKRIYKAKQENFENNKFFKCQKIELSKPPIGEFYRFDYIEDLYKEIEYLQQKEYESREERLNQDPFESYNEDENYELFTEYVNPTNI